MNAISEIIKSSKKLKLLYVEDNKLAREATLMILNEFFKEVIVAVDGEDGFEKFTQNSVDMIITDINMPRMNGLEMTKKIREIDKDIPILVLSAYNESGFFMDSIKLGVDGYLLKPIDMTQFIEALKKIVQKLEITNEVYLLHQYQDVTDISTIVSKSDIDGNITYVNDAYCEVSGYSREELLDNNHNIIRHLDSDSKIYKELWDTIKNKKSIWQGILKNRTKNGDTFYLKTTIKPILNIDGEIIEYISIKSDITTTMNQRKRLIDIAKDSIDVILVLISIEGFDDIEKYYGHELSQVIEEKFGERLLSYINVSLHFDNVFVLGDGEYAIIKNKSNCIIGEEQLHKELLKVQENINDSLIEVEGIEYDISIAISIASGVNSYENARYGIKELQKTKQSFIIANNLIVEEKKEAQKNLDTLKIIKKALDTSNIIIYFQPIIDNKTQTIHKYEALVRLINEEGQVISPYHFLDISKKGKYYYQITARVLEQAFEALQNSNKDISINISALDIEKKQTRDKIFQLLELYKSEASRVVFELLEDEEMKDFQAIKNFITQVKAYGVQIAIDDFGAGYSNFERLLDYQPDILKIDACLVKNIVTEQYSFNVVETIVNFAKKQNIKTVAEYVENEAIYSTLCKIGVDYSQGYFFGKPDIMK